MKIYTIAKYNETKKVWTIISQHTTFREANITLIEEEIIAVKNMYGGLTIKNQLEVPKNSSVWVGILTKKDLDKIYVTKSRKLYKIMESEIF